MLPRVSDARFLPEGIDLVGVILGDIEIGAGGDYDNCPRSDLVGDEIITSCNDSPLRDRPIDLVLNGDTFDLLEMAYLDTHPHHVTTNVALGKIAAIAGAHPRFFGVLRGFSWPTRRRSAASTLSTPPPLGHFPPRRSTSEPQTGRL